MREDKDTRGTYTDKEITHFKQKKAYKQGDMDDNESNILDSTSTNTN